MVALAKHKSKELWEAQYETLQYVDTTMMEPQLSTIIPLKVIPVDSLSHYK